MNNFLCNGERMDVVAPAGGLVSSQLYVVGTKVVVMVTGGAAGVTCAAATVGVFKVPLAAVAVSQGQPLFYDPIAGTITTTAQGNIFAGYAYAGATATDGVVPLLLVDNTPDFNKAAYVAAESNANAVDLPTALTLLNDLKAKFNTLLLELQGASIMDDAAGA
jgi:predicted RecA/RadA family phage recombinase